MYTMLQGCTNESMRMHGSRWSHLGLRCKVIEHMVSIQQAQSLKPETLHCMVRCLDALPQVWLESLYPDQMELVTLVLVKIASDQKEDAGWKIEHLWSHPKEFIRYKNSVLEYLTRTLRHHGPIFYLDDLLYYSISSQKDALKERAILVLKVSLFNETLRECEASLLATAAYVVSTSMGSEMPYRYVWLNI
jgi:hypothetical protein